jgi:hypothetical protein
LQEYVVQGLQVHRVAARIPPTLYRVGTRPWHSAERAFAVWPVIG